MFDWLRTGDDLQISMGFDQSLDAVIVVIDAITCGFLLHRLYRLADIEGPAVLYMRIAFSVGILAMIYQVFSSGGRVIDHPINLNFQSGWALKDISLFMWVTSFSWFLRRANLRKPPAPLPPPVQSIIIPATDATPPRGWACPRCQRSDAAIAAAGCALSPCPRKWVE